MKHKTYGFFDYKYIDPQYHLEQYYTDEKHGTKYGSDAHNAQLKDHAAGEHYGQGYNDYSELSWALHWLV